ncbi:MAG: hypothetical protein M1819_001787 [Sarea resinae]|nr:MAG: hypothetical protein M1819_001787 [Sarea resinae]
MSRHRIKNVGLDDDLLDDDYDYNESADGAEELSTDDKGVHVFSSCDRFIVHALAYENYDHASDQMHEGTLKVRDVLGVDVPVSDQEIKDALWHYYYDVEKTVTWLLNQKAASERKRAKKDSSGRKADAGPNGSKALYPLPMEIPIYPIPFSATEFFRDTPWFGVPSARLGEIKPEPRRYGGGLLGGSSAGGKPSKLAALAAARKRKEEWKSISHEDASNGNIYTEASNSVALLQNFSRRGKQKQSKEKEKSASGTKECSNLLDEDSAGQAHSHKYPIRKRNGPSPARNEEAGTSPDDYQQLPQPIDLRARPSKFARTICGPLPKSLSAPVPIPGEPVFNLQKIIPQNLSELDAFTGPSPDDTVAKAQAPKGGIKPQTSSQKATKAVNQVTVNDSRASSAEEPSRVKSKNLNVLLEYEKSKAKKVANFVVIGHVDAGKSTLMGRLLYDLKVVDHRTLDKLRREAEKIGKSSFALAWVLDQTSEERNRGVTVDIASNKFETEKSNFLILDAPGHRDFIPNMIAGASQADFAVLVVDASTGSFESGLKGQTKEHALLVRSMGVQRIIVVVNKLDTVDWSQERFQEIEQQTSAFLTAAGFQGKNISFVPCSGLTGENIVFKPTEDKIPWYDGCTLVEELENSEPVSRALGKPLRITIADIFRGGVQNPLSVSGRLESGSLQVGDEIVAMPSGEKAHIKGIEVDEEPAEWAVAGQNAVLHLTDIDQVHLKTGDVLCPSDSLVQNITTLTIKILAFDHITPMHVDIHRGRLHVPGRITQLVAVLDKGSGAVIKKRPRLVQPGSVARVKVELTTPTPLEAPSRIVLRSNGQTVAAGLLE